MQRVSKNSILDDKMPLEPFFFFAAAHTHQSDTENGCRFHSHLGVCQSPVGAVTCRPNTCSLSPVTPERFEVGMAMINTAHCDMALKVTSFKKPPPTFHQIGLFFFFLLPHSFRLSRVTFCRNEFGV